MRHEYGYKCFPINGKMDAHFFIPTTSNKAMRPCTCRRNRFVVMHSNIFNAADGNLDLFRPTKGRSLRGTPTLEMGTRGIP